MNIFLCCFIWNRNKSINCKIVKIHIKERCHLIIFCCCFILNRNKSITRVCYRISCMKVLSDKQTSLLSTHGEIIIFIFSLPPQKQLLTWPKMRDHVSLTGTYHQIKLEDLCLIWSGDSCLSTWHDLALWIKLML